jgi:hypothetical protein
VLARITEQSDVVLTNALPEASARLGIDYATVAARNPATSHISILGFGRRPPFGGRRVVATLYQRQTAGHADALVESGTMRREPGPGTAALDVFPAEPEDPAALLPRPDVILTPHIAFSSAHSVLELRRRSTEDLLRVLAGVPPSHPVTT